MIGNKISEFSESRPDIVVVAKSSLWADHLLADEAFGAVMDHYVPLMEGERSLILKRADLPAS
ncbi:hypothetical protein [Hoeflea sp.]|uniref:hypothetical protein n=1 Tax=Hoeflea sp. TaxID=1940281 RepID=UPI003B021B8B